MKGPMAKCLHENCPSVGRGRNILKLRINRCSTSSSARLITWMAVQVRPSDYHHPITTNQNISLMTYKEYLKEKQQRVVVSIDDRIVNEDMVTVADAKKACEMAVHEFAERLYHMPLDKLIELVESICQKPVEP